MTSATMRGALMNQKVLAGLLLPLAMAGGASAGLLGPEYEQHEQPFLIDFSGTNQAELSFPSFNTLNGHYELLSVKLMLQATATLDIGFENMSAFPVELLVQFGPQLNLSAKAGSLTLPYALQGDALVTTTLDLAAADAPAPNQSGPDYVFFGTVSGPIAGEFLLGGPGSVFVGHASDAGPVTVAMSAAHYLGFLSPPPAGTGLRRWVSNFTVSGNAVIEYEFQVVPTPGTLGLVWLALGLTVLRRR